MKLTHLALASAFVLGSTGAMAVGGPLDLSSGSAGFSSTPTAGSFTDIFTFSLTGAVPFFANGSITSALNGNQDVDFTSIRLSGPGGNFNFSQLLGDPFELWSLSTAGVLTAGAYTLTVMGTNSAAIGSYGGNFAVTPVPEPGTLALLLGGLGVVGYLGKRRSS